MKITIDPFDRESVDAGIKELKRYKKWVREKEKELRQRLSMIGASVASIEFSRAVYDGTNDVSVRVEDDGNRATIYAEGQSVLFIEFGSGAKYGYGHPEADWLGYGPSSWSINGQLGGKGHWDDPKGWWFNSGEHSFGNPPAMAMVHARDEIVEQLTQIVRGVFKT